MRRRTFLFGFGASALAGTFEAPAESALGTIAYILKDGLWVRTLPDGQPRRLVARRKLQSPKFSSSGEWITYRSTPDPEPLYKISLNGHIPVRVAKPDPRVFSPDGSSYAYARELDKIDFDTPHNQLWVSNGSASPHRILDDDATLYLWGWSRDKSFLIYWRDPIARAAIDDGLDLFCIPVATGKPLFLKLNGLVNDDFLATCPVADKLAVTAGHGREAWTHKRLALVDLQTGHHTYLTTEETATLYPTWSPDGTHIACCAAPDAEVARIEQRLATGQRNDKGLDPLSFMKQRRIWIVDVANRSSPKQITNDSRYHDEKPIWSREGSRILFGRLRSPDQGTLWLMNGDGSNPSQVTPGLSLDVEDFYYFGYSIWSNVFDWHQPR